MGKQLTEDDLREHGFTDKEIARLREILTRQESNNETYATLIDSLRKRFWGGVIVVCIAFAIVVSWIFNFESNDFTYPLIIIFILIAVWKLTPFPMAFKAYLLENRVITYYQFHIWYCLFVFLLPLMKHL